MGYFFHFSSLYPATYIELLVRNHAKLLHVYKSRRGFSKGTVLCGGYKLWAWQISWALQTCIAERSKVPNG